MSSSPSVRWHASTGDADLALRVHVAEVVGVDPHAVRVGRLCARCGSAEHGRPWASHGVAVSLARAGPHLVTAVSTAGPVGVDVEDAAEVERAWEDLAPVLEVEGVLGVDDRAALWCRTEAALKRDGTGFATPYDVRARDRGRVLDLPAPAGYCAAVADDGAQARGTGGSSGV